MEITSSLARTLACFCALAAVGSAAGAQREPKPPAAPAGPAGAQLQGLLMRSADRPAFATRAAFDQFQVELDTPEKRAAALERQHFMTSAAVTIATQADPDVALLDMIVLVTLERIGAERLWLPKVFGEAGRPYLTALLKLEETIWALGERVMTSPQIEELRAVVGAWETNPPDFFHAASFYCQSRVTAGRVRSAGAGENRSRGLFASVRSAASSADDLNVHFDREIADSLAARSESRAPAAI